MSMVMVHGKSGCFFSLNVPVISLLITATKPSAPSIESADQSEPSIEPADQSAPSIVPVPRGVGYGLGRARAPGPRCPHRHGAAAPAAVAATSHLHCIYLNNKHEGVAPVAPGPAGGPGVAHPALQVRVGEVQLHAVAVAAVLTALALPALALPLQTPSLL